jgi:hypothetical protein
MFERYEGRTEGRYCSGHMGRAPEQGGRWKISANGLNRRWVCAECLARAARREKSTWLSYGGVKNGA